MFEVTEAEPVKDPAHLSNIFSKYREMGFTTAIDDFGSGYAGLSLLSKFRPEVIKLDMELCQGVALGEDKRILTDGIVHTASKLGIRIVAEGIESIEDFLCLKEMGVRLFQGFLFARPRTEALPEVDYSVLKLAQAVETGREQKLSA